MNVEDELIRYIIETTGTTVLPDTPLVEEGIIDSMGVMDLLAFIETTYGINPDMDDLTIENFETVNAIKNFIVSKRGNV